MLEHFDKSTNETPSLIDKNKAMDEYESIHPRLINARSMYIQVNVKQRLLDFWIQIFCLYQAMYENILIIFESILVAQSNICCCERLFGLRKLILNPRRSRLNSENVAKILRIKINSCDCDDFERCKSLYQRCVYFFKQMRQQQQQNSS